MSITLIDLTRIEEIEIKELLEWKASVIEMYSNCLKKKKIGAANAMYVIKCIINDEIKSRTENEDLGIPAST